MQLTTIMTRLRFLLLWPLLILTAALTVLYFPIAVLFGSDRAYRMSLAYDRLANAFFGGSDKETISSRAGRGTNEGVSGWCFLCRALDLVERGHCQKSLGS